MKLNAASPLAIGRHYRFSQYSTRTHSTGDPTTRIRNLLLCLCATAVSCCVCIALQATALCGNYWGHYEFKENDVTVESGIFGLWTVCMKDVAEADVWDCGSQEARRRLVLPAWSAISGICGACSVAFLIGCLIVAVVQLIRLYQGEPAFCANRRALSQKVAPAMFAMIAASACIIFSALAMRRIRSAEVTPGSSFWVEVAGICFTVIVLICTAVESFWRPYPASHHVNGDRKLEESTIRPKPKLQSFYPREHEKLVPPKVEVVMDPRAEHVPPRPSVEPVGERFTALVKTVYRRSNSEGASKSARIS